MAAINAGLKQEYYTITVKRLLNYITVRAARISIHNAEYTNCGTSLSSSRCGKHGYISSAHRSRGCRSNVAAYQSQEML